MNISIFGLGYVGAVSCGCLAELGHNIIGVDVSEHKVDLINAGKSTVTEQGLTEIIAGAVSSGNLSATTDAEQAIRNSEAAILCVGTPSAEDGRINTSFIETVCRQIGEALKLHPIPFFTVINRSTILPEVHNQLREILSESSSLEMGKSIGYVYHPEFLREGCGVSDFRSPSRILFGVSDAASEKVCGKLYPKMDAPVFFVTPDEASLTKYADNCFHAIKVSFANEIGQIGKFYGVDSRRVMEIFCSDKRLNISARYLKPGMAFGGSCLPKDLRAILYAGRQNRLKLPVLDGSVQSNQNQINQILERVLKTNSDSIGIVGLTFKEGTDDVRESPILEIVNRLIEKDKTVSIYDSCFSINGLIGANREFILSAIPNIEDMLASDLQQMIDRTETVILNHRLNAQIWKEIRWDKKQNILDLVHIPELKSVEHYDGLYW